MIRLTILLSLLGVALAVVWVVFAVENVEHKVATISYGPRPFYLLDAMEPGPLKSRLETCRGQEPRRSRFSIGHRGAPLQFPEHTLESFRAAAVMGAGRMECDVTFTKDRALVCRHSHKDLHRTTNILTTDLASTCAIPFTPARRGEKARAKCRVSDITLDQFRQLKGRMDAVNARARSVRSYLSPNLKWRTSLYSGAHATLLSHRESIDLLKGLGVAFAPELKIPKSGMPNGFTKYDLARKLIEEYRQADVPPGDLTPYSFDLEVIRFWAQAEPEYAGRAGYLMAEHRRSGFSADDPTTWRYSMQELRAMGVRHIASPIWTLVRAENGAIVPTALAREAMKAGMLITAGTIERSGPLHKGGGWYFQSMKGLIRGDGDYFRVLDALYTKVGVSGVFTDWPSTVTYYANCMGID